MSFPLNARYRTYNTRGLIYLNSVLLYLYLGDCAADSVNSAASRK